MLTFPDPIFYLYYYFSSKIHEWIAHKSFLCFQSFKSHSPMSNGQPRKIF